MIIGNTIDAESGFTDKEFMGHYSHLCLTSLEDPSLSIFAKGVHIYFITKPKNWIFRPSNIYKRLNISERSYQRALTELEEKGYLYRTHKDLHHWKYIRCENPTKREEVEKLIESGWSLHGCPTGTPIKGAPQTPLNKNIIKKVLNNNIDLLEDKSSNIGVPEGSHQEVRKLKRRINKEKISHGLKKYALTLKIKKHRVIAPKIKNLLDFHSINLHKYRIDSDSYYRSADAIRKLLQGKFFNNPSFNGRYTKYKDWKFTIDDIKQVIQRITLANSLDYYPKDKTPFKSSFADLVYNPNINDEEYKSNFIHYFENEPKHYGNGVSLMDDPDKDLTAFFKRYYKQKALAGRGKEYTNVDENNFRKGTQQALDFINFHKSKLNIRSREYFLKTLEEALDQIPVEMLHPKSFCSDHTWLRVVPNYFEKLAAMEKEQM